VNEHRLLESSGEIDIDFKLDVVLELGTGDANCPQQPSEPGILFYKRSKKLNVKKLKTKVKIQKDRH